jgi:large subunit ribosomal protein L11
MRVVLKAYVDRSFKFVVKPPPTTWFIKKAAGLAKASDKPGQNIVGRVSIKYLYEVAKVKQEVDPDLRDHDIEGITKMIVATARSMGIQVVEDTLPPEPIRVDL